MNTSRLRSAVLCSLLLVAAPFASAARDPVVKALAKIEATGVTFELVTEDTLDDFVLLDYLHPAPVPAASEFGLLATEDHLTGILKTIQRTKGRVVVDCTTFAQVAASVLNGRSKQPVLLVSRDRISPHSASVVHRTHFAYVTLTEGDGQKYLLQSPFMNKGQWLIKLAENAYLGLGSKGIQVDDLPTWIMRTKTGLFGEIDRFRDFTSCDATLGLPPLTTTYANLLDTMRKLGKLDDWRVYDSPAPQIANPSVKR